MAIKHDFCCDAHGEYRADRPDDAPTGWIAPCPSGCDISFCRKIFPTAISVGLVKAKREFVDSKLVEMADKFGVGDFDLRPDRPADKTNYDAKTREDEIMRKRIAGQTYSVPVDPTQDVMAQAGGAPVESPLSAMKDHLKTSFTDSIHVDPRLNDNSKLPDRMAA